MDICNLELSAPVDIQYLLPLPPTASWHFSVDGEILHALLDVEYHDSNAETIEFLQRNSLVRLDISFLLGRTGAIDANIRNVIAVFSLNYWCGIFGKAYVAWAFEELKKRDRLQVKLFLARRLVGFPDLRLRLNLDVNRLEAEIAFINQKIRRRRTAMHIELLSYLFQRFDTLIWPALDVRGISSSQNRPFGSDRVRQLLFVIGHSELLARAKRMARQYQGKRVVSGSEFQGTIRCSWCGHKNDSFAGDLSSTFSRRCRCWLQLAYALVLQHRHRPPIPLPLPLPLQQVLSLTPIQCSYRVESPTCGFGLRWAHLRRNV